MRNPLKSPIIQAAFLPIVPCTSRSGEHPGAVSPARRKPTPDCPRRDNDEFAAFRECRGGRGVIYDVIERVPIQRAVRKFRDSINSQGARCNSTSLAIITARDKRLWDP